MADKKATDPEHVLEHNWASIVPLLSYLTSRMVSLQVHVYAFLNENKLMLISFNMLVHFEIKLNMDSIQEFYFSAFFCMIASAWHFCMLCKNACLILTVQPTLLFIFIIF